MVCEPLAPTPPGIDSDAWRSVTEAVRAYCGWHIAPSVTETVIVDGSGMPTLHLPTLHLTEIISITNKGTAFTLTDTDTWDWSLNGTVRLYYQNFPWQLRGVEVEMTHGFDACPTELLDVCTTVARRAAFVPANGGGRFMAGPFQVDYPEEVRSGLTGFTATQYRTLDRYAIPLRP